MAMGMQYTYNNDALSTPLATMNISNALTLRQNPQQQQVQVVHALPTPPFSPPQPNRAMQHTINLLDSLAAFYHQERMWVYRTRAQLECTLELPGPTPVAAITAGPDPSTQQQQQAGAAVKTEDVYVKSEDMSDEHDLSGPSNAPPTTWMRRKRSFKLKLEGLSAVQPRRRTANAAVGRAKQMQAQTDSGVQILELFEAMMQSRMESCERVNRMVRNRANEIRVQC